MALATRGTLAAFLVPRRQYPRWLYPGGRDVDERACPRLEQAAPSFSVLEPWTWGRLRRMLRAASPDAIVMPYWTWAWAPLDVRLLAWRAAPVIAIVHNPADHDAHIVARRAARAVLAGCRGFFCHAEAVAATVRGQLPGRPTRVYPLPPDRAATADRGEARRALGVPGGATAFLCFGLMRPYKGVDVLLEAFLRLRPGCPAHLLLAGEPWGDVGADVKRRLATPGLASRVTARLEWVPEDAAGTWFAAADVAVMAYRSATGSAVAAQALGAGLPLLATAVGGLEEVVRDGENGLLVPPGDAGALAEAIERACDAALRARLAEGARRTAERLSWDSYAAELESLVADVVKDRKT